MREKLTGLKLTILGGDAREIFLAKHLAGIGSIIKAMGLPATGENITVYENLAEALEGARAVILPVPGISDEGKLYGPFLEKPVFIAEKDFNFLAKNTPVLVGTAKPLLKKIAFRLQLNLIEFLSLDEVAILNSIPSAEGAIQLAMEKMPITIHSCESFVLGFGRTGMTLAQLLVAMGAKTTVIARNPAQRARASQINCRTYDFSELPFLISQADVIFNTVPALIIDEPLLKRASPQILIIDIASAPGGINFEAAKLLGIQAILAPGLPGKVAPDTAGRILARVIPRLLAEHLN